MRRVAVPQQDAAGPELDDPTAMSSQATAIYGIGESAKVPRESQPRRC